MSAPDLDGWKKLIEEARAARENPHWAWPAIAGFVLPLAAALDSAVAHIGRLEAQRDEALALHQPEKILTVGGSDVMCAECRKRPASAYDVVWPCKTKRILSRTDSAMSEASAPHHEHKWIEHPPGTIGAPAVWTCDCGLYSIGGDINFSHRIVLSRTEDGTQ